MSTTIMTPPYVDLEPVDIETIPVDPALVDALPPVDINVCPACMGDGCVVTFDQGEGQSDECWNCCGTGLRGAW